MKCIYCGHKKTEINNSRPSSAQSRVWRRRECPNCHKIFSTTELPVFGATYTVHNETTHTSTPYSRTMLAASILPTMSTIGEDLRFKDTDALLDTVEQRIITAARDNAVSKDDLAAIVYEVLKAYDAVTGLQYGIQHGLLATVAKRRRGRPSIS